ncbi:MAG: hypothetical protein P4L85_01280 [Paludisphaera borealis]|uniref:hypothetical protein n=1 Tax=Paludisphaera borealis TaxID=1387353 RepID=UPI002841DB3F|nr:hypothetical protein [Paludisphaera borealis]MDR3617952.1 hypothetical protein [Paludisphaera borealis]
MRIWDRIVLLAFPGSLEEYRDARKIHCAEIRRYRTQPQFIAGLCLFFAPVAYLLLTSKSRHDWTTVALIVCIVFGEIFIRDTISEHYCLLLHRLGYASPDSNQTGKSKAASTLEEV